jgi:hypothetical protein
VALKSCLWILARYLESKGFDYQINTSMNPDPVRLNDLASILENPDPPKSEDLFGKSILRLFDSLRKVIETFFGISQADTWESLINLE